MRRISYWRPLTFELLWSAAEPLWFFFQLFEFLIFLILFRQRKCDCILCATGFTARCRNIHILHVTHDCHSCLISSKRTIKAINTIGANMHRLNWYILSAFASIAYNWGGREALVGLLYAVGPLTTDDELREWRVSNWISKLFARIVTEHLRWL